MYEGTKVLIYYSIRKYTNITLVLNQMETAQFITDWIKPCKMKSQSNTGNRKKIFVVNCCGILETWMKM
jgi:hypothetical protein